MACLLLCGRLDEVEALAKSAAVKPWHTSVALTTLLVSTGRRPMLPPTREDSCVAILQLVTAFRRKGNMDDQGAADTTLNNSNLRTDL